MLICLFAQYYFNRVEQLKDVVKMISTLNTLTTLTS